MLHHIKLFGKPSAAQPALILFDLKVDLFDVLVHVAYLREPLATRVRALKWLFVGVRPDVVVKLGQVAVCFVAVRFEAHIDVVLFEGNLGLLEVVNAEVGELRDVAYELLVHRVEVGPVDELHFPSLTDLKV